jgi:hypothetical protein
MQKLLMSLVLCLAGAIFADPGNAQPVGGNVTGGNPTGGNVTGGNPTGGNPTGGNPTGGNVTGGNVTGGNVGVNVGEERRFILEFQEFAVRDETGCDICGSDEARFIIRTPDYAMISSEYGNLDSYERIFLYRFKRCAQPAVDGDNETDWEWECDQKGKAAPFSFTVAAYEDDGPRPIFWNDCWTDSSYRGADGRYTDLRPPDYGFCIESDGRAELIGKTKVELKLEDLTELQSPGQSFSRTINLIGGCDDTLATCGSSGGPHYEIRYEVKRVPDATGGLLVNPNP